MTLLPDLRSKATLIGFGRAPGNTAPFSALVENVGNWGSHGGRLTVYDTAPDLPAHTFC